MGMAGAVFPQHLPDRNRAVHPSEGSGDAAVCQSRGREENRAYPDPRGDQAPSEGNPVVRICPASRTDAFLHLYRLHLYLWDSPSPDLAKSYSQRAARGVVALMLHGAL